jgi:hypothetical protein
MESRYQPLGKTTIVHKILLVLSASFAASALNGDQCLVARRIILGRSKVLVKLPRAPLMHPATSLDLNLVASKAGAVELAAGLGHLPDAPFV